MFRRNFLQESGILSLDEVLLLIAYRQKYSYPRASLVIVHEPTGIQLAKDCWVKPRGVREYCTDLMHDEYHRRLMTSSNLIDVRLGVASTIFWGFYTHNESLALWRAGQHLTRADPERVFAAVRAAIDAEDTGKALSHFQGINQLGQMPFGSKVVTKLLPQQAGTMDGKLYKALQVSQWAASAPFVSLGLVGNRRVQESFKRWCELLQRIAAQLNAGIDRGAIWHWTLLDGKPARWRAVDVERAMFAYYSLQGVGTVVKGGLCGEQA